MLTILCFGFSANVKANRHYMGIQGGMNISKLSQPDNSSIESINNYLFGVTGIFSINQWMSFQPEVIYTVKGAKGNAIYGSNSSGSIEGTATLKYLELPLLFRFMYPNSSNVIPHVFVGPALATNMSAEAKGMWGSRPVNGDTKR